MDKGHVKIFFRLEKDKDDYPPEDVESLWAIPRESGFELDNIPFFVKGVALGDIVKVEKTGDCGLEFVEVVRRSGHSCYRIWLRQRREDDPSFTIKELESLGLKVETDMEYLLAIDVPPDISLKSIEDVLFKGEDSGRWGLQEGYRADY